MGHLAAHLAVHGLGRVNGIQMSGEGDNWIAFNLVALRGIDGADRHAMLSEAFVNLAGEAAEQAFYGRILNNNHSDGIEGHNAVAVFLFTVGFGYQGNVFARDPDLATTLLGLVPADVRSDFEAQLEAQHAHLRACALRFMELNADWLSAAVEWLGEGNDMSDEEIDVISRELPLFWLDGGRVPPEGGVGRSRPGHLRRLPPIPRRKCLKAPRIARRWLVPHSRPSNQSEAPMAKKKTRADLPAGTNIVEERAVPAHTDHIGGAILLTYRQDPRTYDNTWRTMFERSDGEIVLVHDFGYDRSAAEADLAFRAGRGS